METMQAEPKIVKPTSLLFGVLCNGKVFQRWQADALDELAKHGHRLFLLIVDARKVPEIPRFKQLLKKKWNIFLFTFMDNRFFKPMAKKPVDLFKDLTGIDTMHVMVERKGYSEYFSDKDIANIRGYRLDFILRFGFNIIRGGILTAARFGVWSFHHDDEMVFRGGPPGFWEIFKNDPVSGAIMQQLTDKLDGGIILQKGYLKTIMHSYRENLNQLLSVSSAWPARFADELSNYLGHPDGAPFPMSIKASNTSAPVYKVPSNRQMLKFLFFLLRNRIRFYYRDMVAAEIWNVGLIKKPIHEVALKNGELSETDITWLPPVANSGYLADPGGFIEAGTLHILAEDYSYAAQKADISEVTMKLGNGKAAPIAKFEKPVSVMDSIPHLSYPYVFGHDSEIYCLPESYQSSQIILYRRDRATGRFNKDRTILDNVKAVDPVLFFNDGFWWLFFTDRANSNTHLFLYFSQALSGEFKPHCLNPVKIDIRSARSAGTPFIHANILYRPAQDCSVTYGGRVAINRILRMNVNDFAEETVNFINPAAGSRYDKGLHTISAVGNFTLIDGKRYKLDHLFFWHQLQKKLTRKDPENV